MAAGVASDPYLMTGYDRKALSLSHRADREVRVRVEVDLTGSADQVPTGFNVPVEGSTKPACYCAFRAMLTDTALMDVKMPVMDGWEATRRIRALPLGRHVPIIALTAQAMAGDEQKALAALADEGLSRTLRADLWRIVDCREWSLRMLVRDFAAELEQIDREIEDELRR